MATTIYLGVGQLSFYNLMKVSIGFQARNLGIFLDGWHRKDRQVDGQRSFGFSIDEIPKHIDTHIDQ